MSTGNQDQKQTWLYRLLSSPQLYRITQNFFGRKKGYQILLNEYMILKEGNSVLDIGCGTADIVDFFPANINYVGFDINSRYIEYAQAKYKDKVKLFCKRVSEADAVTLEKFDYIISLAVVHHLNDEEAIDLYRLGMGLLKPEGIMIIIDPTRNNSDSFIAKLLTNHDRGEHIRFPNQYEQIAKKVFPKVDVYIRNDMINIAQSICIIVCKK
jgi:2-polyprenyl-3-methyl-5-hydroxy-6-metoxy-1,4-benzoquinol methylase